VYTAQRTNHLTRAFWIAENSRCKKSIFANYLPEEELGIRLEIPEQSGLEFAK
jgi:hypothetical protein